MVGVLCLGAVLFGAPPAFVVEAGLEPPAEFVAVAIESWRGLERLYQRETLLAPTVSVPSVRLRRADRLASGEGGESLFGVIALRQARPGQLSERERATLRHEVAHQFLFAACPAASGDRLFHEAFALATSGELSTWRADPARADYLSTPQAARELARVTSLDTPRARRALARLLEEGAAVGAPLPPALSRRLRRCAAGAGWATPMSVDELAAPAAAVGTARVVLSRHSGEVLESDGDAGLPMPFGSTLKPFLVAGASLAPPPFPPDPRRPEWLCGDDLPAAVDAPLALLRSCNGYFLAWGTQAPEAARFGRFGPLLVELGLGRLPAEMSEAIGLKPTLLLSPWALAQAYRALAAASPATLALLRDNHVRGTLAGLPASPGFSGWATKTGTVRGPDSRPRLGLIVAVDEELVIVETVAEQAPRSFAAKVAERLARLPRAGQAAATVQTFALVPAQQLEARCGAVPFVAGAPPANRPGADGFVGLLGLIANGEALCLGAPWLVRFPGLPREGRPYAGSFSFAALSPPDPAAAGRPRQLLARRGSEVWFRTSLARYTAGVLAAEDDAITGAARLALGRVVAHNVAIERHPGRPLCDTTHCQAFRGTRPPRAGDQAIFTAPPLRGDWLLFSRGGDEPWESRHPRAEVAALLGDNPTAFRVVDGRLHYQRTVASHAGAHDEASSLPCDLVRDRLRLPACPTSVRHAGEELVFAGRGWGHGQGLEVEWAKTSGLDADQILRRAYGAAVLDR